MRTTANTPAFWATAAGNTARSTPEADFCQQPIRQHGPSMTAADLPDSSDSRPADAVLLPERGGGDIRDAVANRQSAHGFRPHQVVELLPGDGGCLHRLSVPPEDTIDILDILHVSSYIWRAAKVFYPHREHQEAFARDRLLRMLQGDVHGVVAGLRQMATKRRLKGKGREEIATVCGYFEKHAHRMRYHEYLAAGYPIATGVIEELAATWSRTHPSGAACGRRLAGCAADASRPRRVSILLLGRLPSRPHCPRTTYTTSTSRRVRPLPARLACRLTLSGPPVTPGCFKLSVGLPLFIWGLAVYGRAGIAG